MMIKVLLSTFFLLAFCGASLIGEFAGPRKLKLPLGNSNNKHYYTELYVGENTTFKVLVETGRSRKEPYTSVLLTLPYKNPNYLTEATYNCSESPTCDIEKYYTGKTYELGPRYRGSYTTLSFEVRGYFGHELVGLTQDFKVNSSALWTFYVDSNFFNDIDGFMSFSSFELDNSYLDQAYQQNYIQEKVFSFYFDYSDSNSSYMTIGYIPEDKVNNLTWVSMDTDATKSWALTYENVQVGNKTFEKFLALVAIEVGAAFISLNSNAYSELKTQLDSMEHFGDAGDTFYICNDNYLDKYPNITYKLENIELVIDFYSYLDFANPRGPPGGKTFCKFLALSSGGSMELLGSPFVRNNFVAFSKGNQSVGIHQETKRISLGSYYPSPIVEKKSYLLEVLVGVGLLFVAVLVVVLMRKRNESENSKHTLKDDEFHHAVYSKATTDI